MINNLLQFEMLMMVTGNSTFCLLMILRVTSKQKNLTEVRIKPGTIARVVIWHTSDGFVGLELYDKYGVLLLEPTWKTYKTY